MPDKTSYDPALFRLPPQQIPANMPPGFINAYQTLMAQHIPPRFQRQWTPTPNFLADQPTTQNPFLYAP